MMPCTQASPRKHLSVLVGRQGPSVQRPHSGSARLCFWAGRQPLCLSLPKPEFHEASLMAQTIKNLPAVQETWVPSLGREDPLEKEMATQLLSFIHTSGTWKLAWKLSSL